MQNSPVGQYCETSWSFGTLRRRLFLSKSMCAALFLFPCFCFSFQLSLFSLLSMQSTRNAVSRSEMCWFKKALWWSEWLFWWLGWTGLPYQAPFSCPSHTASSKFCLNSVPRGTNSEKMRDYETMRTSSAPIHINPPRNFGVQYDMMYKTYYHF